jgi:site-specific recombinase XerD
MGTTLPHPVFEDALERFLWVLEGRSRSPHTLTAYAGDLSGFFAWLGAQRPPVASPLAVTRRHVDTYLGHLSRQQLSGVTRARKLAAIRAFFRYLEGDGELPASPANGVETPRKERKVPVYLTRSEYSRVLAEAAAAPEEYAARDFAIFMVFLQTGIRVSELCELRVGDVDLKARTIRVRGKGQAERVIELERKGTEALRRWLAARPDPDVVTDRLFLNRYAAPIGVRGVKKLVATYLKRAGITKKLGAHGLRHTFATAKGEQGVSPFLLKDWMGHRSLNTTQLYVNLARRSAQKVMEDTSL